MAAARDPRRPPAFSEVFSEAIAAQALTLDRLQARLRSTGASVSSATLSYWQTGRSVPTRKRSLKAVEELERILELPNGHLTSALPLENFIHWDPVAVVPGTDVTMRLLADMGLDLARRNCTGVLDVNLMVIGGDGTQESQESQQLLRSETDGFDRLPTIFQQDSGDDDAAPELEALSGCRIGQVASIGEHHLVVAELLLPRPLARGELHQVGYRAHWAPTSAPAQRMERGLLNPNRFLVTTVQFRGEAPRSAEYYHLPQMPPTSEIPDPDEVPGEPVPVARGEVQVAIPDAQAGVHGLRWQW